MAVSLDVAKYLTDMPQPLDAMNKDLLDIYSRRQAAKLGQGELDERIRSNRAGEVESAGKAQRSAMEKLAKETEQSSEDLDRAMLTFGRGKLIDFLAQDKSPGAQQLYRAMTDPGLATGNPALSTVATLNQVGTPERFAKLMELTHPKFGTLRNYMVGRARDLGVKDPEAYVKDYMTEELFFQPSIPDAVNAIKVLRLRKMATGNQKVDEKKPKAPSGPEQIAPVTQAPAIPEQATPAQVADVQPPPVAPFPLPTYATSTAPIEAPVVDERQAKRRALIVKRNENREAGNKAKRMALMEQFTAENEIGVDADMTEYRKKMRKYVERRMR